MKLFVVLLASSIAVISVQAPIFATAQGSIEISSNANNQNAPNLFPEIPGYKLVFLYRDTAYENVAHQDMALVYGYFPTNLSKQVVYVDIGISRSYSNLHNWEVCLIGLQTAKGQNPFVNVLNSKDIQLLKEPSPLVANYLEFQNQGYTQNTLYWYEQVSFKTDYSVEQKYVRISLIVLTPTSENSSLQPEMIVFGQTIASQWAPLQNQSLAAFGVPTLQFLFIVSLTFLTAAKIWQFFISQRTKKKNLKIFNNLASLEEKQVLQGMNKYAMTNKLIRIGDLFQYLQTQKSSLVNFEKFLKILNTLEEHGFLNRKVVSVENTPILILKL